MPQLILMLILCTGLKFHFVEFQNKRAYPPRVWYLKKACKRAIKNRLTRSVEIQGL
jgi:hypothetical protein